METTFITIQDLSPEARILYTSDSIVDILGYAPNEVVNRSCWDFFHPEELPMAKAKHGRGIDLDKAAMLSYCRMRNKEGNWLGCEVVFTVVYNVMVGSRASEAPVIRRLFSNSPKDPRYHMLSHLSSKFMASPKAELHEPRAALFLNRYTRTLTIMYATDGLADLLGISGEEMRGKSFYYCIQETCLRDAVRCLENAKANDSIAYLRFWFRNPRDDGVQGGYNDSGTGMDIDGEPDDIRSSDGDQDMGNSEPSNGNLHPLQGRNGRTGDSQAVSSDGSPELTDSTSGSNGYLDERTSSGESSNPYTHEAVFGEPAHRSSSASSMSNSPVGDRRRLNGNGYPRSPNEPVELEAVVSCTSDGLVVCLRQARSPMPIHQPTEQTKSMYDRGLFAVPWSPEPIIPPVEQRLHYAQPRNFIPNVDTAPPPHLQAAAESKSSNNDFMNSIRDIAVFAWALVGINGSLADYSRGKPCGEAQPPGGLPVWTPEDTQHKSNGFRDGQRTYIDGQHRYNDPVIQSRQPHQYSAHPGTQGHVPNTSSAPTPNFSMPRQHHPAANTMSPASRSGNGQNGSHYSNAWYGR
ncbi:MAG: hypothetical protein M1828_006616 [Chrysothrix sp. TS-e1954]|nr:MAG: hypothetical protein M1828_006616 [Chrysothrix sp. TS-e1954]